MSQVIDCVELQKIFKIKTSLIDTFLLYNCQAKTCLAPCSLFGPILDRIDNYEIVTHLITQRQWN